MELIFDAFGFGMMLVFYICGVILGIATAIALIVLAVKYWVIVICALLALGALTMLPYR